MSKPKHCPAFGVGQIVLLKCNDQYTDIASPQALRIAKVHWYPWPFDILYSVVGSGVPIAEAELRALTPVEKEGDGRLPKPIRPVKDKQQ